MDRMYAPWRLAFLKGQVQDDIPRPSGCIFCDYPLKHGVAPPDGVSRRDWDKRRLVVTVREHAFVVLNKYPYGNGHVMVVPTQHTDKIEALDDVTFQATHRLLHETIAALRDTYRPHGLNIGMNMGEAGGAGIAEHAHYHAVPRWKGDVNFMPVFSDTKVISESLEDTWDRLASIVRRDVDDA